MVQATVDKVIDNYNGDGKSLLRVLKDIQDDYQWLPIEALEQVSKRFGFPATKVYRAAIFGKGLCVIPRNHHLVDANVCIVDLVKYYLDFLQHDLCGKCLPCREGMKQMYSIVSDIAEGKGKEEDIELLKEVSGWIPELSACKQGIIVANIILTALNDFQDQFEAHLNGDCPASVCASLR